MLLLTTMLLTQVGWGQSNPAAFDLSTGSFSFTTQTSTNTSYPTNIQGWNNGGTANLATLTTAASTADITLTASATASTSGIGNLGANGFQFLTTGAVNTVGAIAIAINTTGRTSIAVTWTAADQTNNASGRQMNMTLQYRVGTSGSFTTVSSSTYTTNGSGTQAASTFSNIALPVACENQSVVQLRWIYYESASQSGSRDAIRLDDITVSSSSSGNTAPTLSSPTSASITNTTATLGATITGNGGASITASGVTYGTSASPTGNATLTDPLVTSNSAFTVPVSSLSPQTLYYYRGYATNSVGTTYTSDGTFRTLSNPPTAQAGSFVAAAANTSLNVSWSAATFPGSGATNTGYALIYAASPTTPTLSSANGAAPAAGAGTLVNITSGATLTNTISSLTNGTTYNLLIVPYTWDGTNNSTYNYLTASAPTTTGTPAVPSYYLKTDSDPTVTANWGTASDGSGSNPSAMNIVANWYVTQNSNTPTTNWANTWTLGAGSSISVQASTTFNIAGTLTLGAVQISAAGASATINATANALIQITNTAGFSGTATTAISTTNSPTITLNSASTVEYNGTGTQTVTTAIAYGNLKFSGSGGTYRIASGLGTSTSVPLTLANGTLTISNGTLNVNYGSGASYLQVGGVNISAGTLDATSTSTSSPSTYLLINGSWSQSGSSVVGYTGTKTGRIIFTGGGSNTFTGLTPSANFQYWNLQVSNNTTLTFGSNVSVNGYVNGTMCLTVDAGSTLIDAGYTILANNSTGTSSGNAFVINGIYKTSNANGFTGTVSTTISSSSTSLQLSSSTYNTISLGANSTIEYNASSTQTLTSRTDYGNLTLTGGSKTAGTATITVAKTFTINSGATYNGGTNNPALNVAGDFTNSGTFTQGSGLVTFNGSSAQAFTRFGTGDFGSLTLNNSTGLTLNNDLSVTGTLTLTSGNITTGNNTLAVSSTGSVSRTSGHIVGKLKKNIAVGATSKTYEIGSSSAYSPVTVVFDNVSVAGNLTANVSIPGAAPAAASSIHPTKYLNRSWTLANSGIAFTSYGATFTFVAGDVQGSASTSNFIGAKYDGSTWTNPTVGTKTATTTQLTGITSFSDFYLGEPGAPTVTTSAATSISTTGATLNATVNDNGSNTTPGFDYGTTTSYGSSGTPSPSSITGGTGATAVTSNISSLSINTQYNFRANATNVYGSTNGSNLTFYTLANIPGVPSVSSPTNTTLDVAISDVNSNPSSTEFAIWITGSQYVQSNGSLGATAVWQTASAWGTKTVTGLSGGTTYTFKIKARNGDLVETSFGSTADGTTSSSVPPTVSSPTYASITNTSATLGGNVTSDGGDPITDRGIVWAETSLNADPSIGGANVTQVTTTGTTGIFTKSVSSLPVATQISFKAYATNSQGTGYTSVSSFYTLANEPSLQATSVNLTNINSSGFTVGWTNGDGSRRAVFMREATAGSISNPVDANSYTASSDWASKGTQLGTSGYYCIYNGSGSSVSISNASAQTRYYIQVFEYNSDGSVSTETINYLTSTGTVNPGNGYTLSQEPASYSASFSGSALSTTSISLSFSSASTITNGAGYIVLQKSGSSAPSGTPSDGNSYTVGSTIGDGTVAAIITSTSTTSTTISSLSYASQYSYTLIPYNWDGSNAATYNYKTDPTIPTTNATTLTPSAPTVTSPTATSISATTATVGGNVTLDGGDPVTERGVVWSETATNSDPVIGGSGVTKVVTSGTTGVFTLNGTGLTAGVSISYKAYATNSTGTGYTSVGTFTTLAAQPTTAATLMTFTNTTINSLTVGWTNGNGANRIVVARLNSTTRVAPSNATSYSVNSSSFADGTNATTGTGNVVVYNGSASSVNVTGLSALTTYAFDVYEYNGSGVSANYSANLSSSKSTLASEPTSQASNLTFTSVGATSMTINWTKGSDADNSLVVVKVGSSVDDVPVDGTSYTATQASPFGTQIGTGNYVVYRATLGTVTITGLSDGSTYYVAVYSYKGTAGSGTENYLTTSPATGSQTAQTPTYYSKGSYDASNVTNWSISRDGTGAAPVDFTTNAANFVIQGTHSMTVGVAFTLGTTGSKLQIENGGTLTAGNALTIATAATLQIDNGGTYIHNNTVAFGTSIFNGSEILASNSNFEIQSYNTSSSSIPLVEFGNLTINNTSDLGASLQCGANLTTVKGNLKIQSLGGTREFRLGASLGYSLSVSGDLIVEGGVLDFASSVGSSASRNVSVGGSLTQTGGTIKCTGSSNPVTLSFTGSGKTLTISAGTYTGTNINLNVASGASLTINSPLTISSSRSLTVDGTLICGTNVISGSGTFALNSGATFSIGSTGGIASSGATGNIQTSTRTFSATANYTYNGSAAQVTGSGLPATVNNLTVDNTAGLTASGSLTVNGVLNLTNGKLSIGSNTLTLAGTVSSMTAANCLTGSTTSNVTVTGTGSLGTLYFDQTTPGTTDNIATFTLNRSSSGTATLGSNVRVGTSLTLTSGKLTIGSNTLSLAGTVSSMSSANCLTGSAGSNLSITGTGALGTLYFDQTTPGTTDNIATFTLNRTSSGTATLGSNASVGTSLTLTNGTLADGGFTITNAGNIAGTGTHSGTGKITMTGSGKTIAGATLGNLEISSAGTVSLSANASVTGLTLTGGTLADGGFTLTNSGNISGTGTHSGAGKITMTGSGKTISAATLSNLELNHAGGFSLTGSPSIGGLTFVAGKLTLGNYDASVSGSISGQSSSSYVVTDGSGSLKRSVTTSGSFAFPVGTNNYAPVTFTIGSVGTPGTISARTTTADHPQGANGFPLDYTRKLNRYWTIENSGVDVSGTNMAQVDFNWVASELGSTVYSFNIRNLMVAKYSGSSWSPAHTTNPTSTSITASQISSFSDFVVALPTGAAVLPVSLTSFSGYKDGIRNQLRWVTATEINNSGFEVQRSADGQNYQSIGFVNSQATGGNSQSQLKYSFTDVNPSGIKQYYRLRQFDIDGRSTLSNILLIQGEKPTSLEIASVYPNPARSLVTLLLNAPDNRSVKIQLVDLAGRILQTRQVNLLAGNNSIPFDLSSLAIGQYLISVDGKGVKVVRE